ncbi:MAG: hypothetical protein KUG75_05215, partial [Pseudomonadales bacterium]|nr:hypothetical protein [Pseudomonadales bacterium]
MKRDFSPTFSPLQSQILGELGIELWQLRRTDPDSLLSEEIGKQPEPIGKQPEPKNKQPEPKNKQPEPKNKQPEPKNKQ